MSDFKGIVLTNTTIHDADIIMNVLSEKGKVSIKAKGVLKPNSKNRSVTEVGCYSYFHTIDRMNQSTLLLKNAECVKRFVHIQNDLEKQTICQCLLEGFNKIDISLEQAIQYIDYLDHANNPYCLYALFLCHLIQLSGISLVVDECVNCHTNHGLYGFSFQDGGFICKNCYDFNQHHHLSIQELKNIRYCMHAKIQDYIKLEEVSHITYDTCDYLFRFFEQYGEIHLKSHAFLKIIQPLG